MSEAASSSGEEEVGVLIAAKDKVLEPLKIVVSKPARRLYLNVAFLIVTYSFLLGASIAAYLILYYNYIPHKAFSHKVDLQYEAGRYPYGSVQLGRTLSSDQPYDVKVVLHLPRSPINQAAGNFMVNIDLLRPEDTTSASKGDVPDRSRILATARRQAIIPYQHAIMEHAHARSSFFSSKPHPGASPSELLEIKMLKDVEFSRGRRSTPSTLQLEIQSMGLDKLQIYDATVFFESRLRGLRYFMHTYWITSFVLFTTSFWMTSMLVSTAIWAVLSMWLSSGPSSTPTFKTPRTTTQEPTIKREQSLPTDTPALSDTERIFPGITNSSSRQHPLHFKVKKEEDFDTEPSLQDIPLAAEADVEDEDGYVSLGGRDSTKSAAFHDSGIGTSMESGVEAERSQIRKRTGPRRAA